MGKAEAGTEGAAETDTVNTAKTGIRDMARIGVVGMAGEATADTPTSAEMLNSPKVSANREIDMQIKRGKSELNKERRKRKEENTYPLSRVEHSPLPQIQKSSSLDQAHPQDPQRSPQTPLRTIQHEAHAWQKQE